MSQGLSIIIVNYNGAQFLKDSVLSFGAFMQQYQIAHEFLIMDNASTDKSAEVINELQAAYPNIRPVFSQINHGFGKANNILIRQARYPVLVLLNNDTLSVSLAELCTLAARSDVDPSTIYTCQILNADHSRQKNTFNYPRLFNVFVDLFLIKKPLLRLYQKLSKNTVVIEDGYFSGCYLVLSRELFERAGAFDESFFFYHEECDLFIRAERLGIKKRILRDQIIHYGSGGAGISDFAFQNYYVNLAGLLIKNGFGSAGAIKMLFRMGFRWRIFLLRLGFRIAYSPFANTYVSGKGITTISRSHLVDLHQDTLYQIQKLKP